MIASTFKIAGWAPVVESTLQKQQEKFLHSITSLSCTILMFRKVALLEISRNSFLTGVAGLQSTGCNTTKNKLLTKFSKSLLKISMKSSVMEFLFSNLQMYKMQRSAPCGFKNLESSL